MVNSMQGYSPTPPQGQKLKGYDFQQLSNYTPEQMQLFQQSMSNAGPGSYMSRLAGGDQSMWDQIEAPAMRQFNELQGQNASRFSQYAPGSMGARHGSGFQNYQNAATSNFAQDLQSKRMQLQMGAIKDLHGMSQDLLGNQPYDQFYTPKQKSFWEQLMGGVAPVAGAGIGAFLGGPAGAAVGLKAGSAFSNAFN